jgi:hypothetical protein
MENSQQVYTLVSNYAGITVAKPTVMLSVIVPDQKADWEFTRLELFDRQCPQAPITSTSPCATTTILQIGGPQVSA